MLHIFGRTDVSPGSQAPRVSGDRHPAIRRVFPSSMFYRNGGRLIDVTQDITYLPGGGAIGNAIKNGTNADQTTAAIKHYMNFFRNIINSTPGNSRHRNFPAYFPIGDYLTNDSLLWDGEINSEIDHSQNWRFIGERRSDTIIRLAAGSPGFGAGTNKPMLSIIKSAISDGKLFNNIESKAGIFGLTFEVGANNPGAVGIRITGANCNSCEDVTVRSVDPDRRGSRGIFLAGCSQFHLQDITVEGFDHGIFAEHPHVTFGAPEYVTVRDQRISGFTAVDSVFGMRRVFSDQSAANVPAVSVTGPYGFVSALDCDFVGQVSPAPAISLNAAAHCFLGDLRTEGYGNRVRRGATFVQPGGGTVDEYKTAVFSSFDSTNSYRITPRDVPLFAWPETAGDWAVATDASDFQTALDAGKAGVVLRRGNGAGANSVSIGTVHVPAGVKIINLMYADVNPDNQIIIDTDTGGPLLITGAWSGPIIQLNGKNREVVVHHMGDARVRNSNPLSSNIAHMIGMSSTNNGSAPTGLSPPAPATGPNFTMETMQLYCRAINNEPRARSPYNNNDNRAVFHAKNGCQVWVLCGKTETNLTAWRSESGAKIDVHGWLFNQTPFASSTFGPNAAAELVDVIDGRASVNGVSSGHGSSVGYTRATSSKDGATVRTIAYNLLPPRHYRNATDNHAFLPLFVEDI